MELLLIVASLFVLILAAARWGHDSRDGFTATYGRGRFRF
jgi:hypothetical protein